PASSRSPVIDLTVHFREHGCWNVVARLDVVAGCGVPAVSPRIVSGGFQVAPEDVAWRVVWRRGCNGGISHLVATIDKARRDKMLPDQNLLVNGTTGAGFNAPVAVSVEADERSAAEVGVRRRVVSGRCPEAVLEGEESRFGGALLR